MKSANKSTGNVWHALRSACIAIHRDLGYFFAGVVLVYAISGIAMNHRNSFNPYFSAQVSEFVVPFDIPSDPKALTHKHVDDIIDLADETGAYTKHYISRDHLKILLRGGSSIDVDLASNRAVHEHVSERIVIGNMARLHYNPGSWWTTFSDIFAVALILITLTGFFIIRGKKGFMPRGLILLLVGLLFPIIFLLA